MISLVVFNVSKSGFGARVDRRIRVGLPPVRIRLAIGEFEVAEVHAIPAWRNGADFCGFQIVQSCKAWDRFIDYLTCDQFKERDSDV